MKRLSQFILITGSLFLLGCQSATRSAVPVDSVTDVKIEWKFRATSMLVVHAKGMVSSGGWSDAKLKPRKNEPWVFDLVAVPPAPGSTVTMAFEEVKAAYHRNYLSRVPEKVTVHAAGNSITEPVPPNR